MRRDHLTSCDQLALFDIPATGRGVRPRRSSTLRRSTRARVLVSLLALGVASAGIVAGSFAAWTTQTTNPGNQVKAGSLTMTNSRNATALFSATNVKPGDTGSSTVVINNAGSIPMRAMLTQDQVTASGIEDSLGLKVHDDTRNWCYWPVSQAGACPAPYGDFDADGSIAALPLASTTGALAWPAGEAHTFSISWTLAATSPNSDQGKTGSFRLIWDGA